MNTRKKQKLLKLVKQYKISTGKRLNEAQQNLQKIVNDKFKQLNMPITIDSSINTGAYNLYKKLYDKNIKKQIKSIISLMFDKITLKIGLVTSLQNNYAKIILQYEYTHPGGGSNGKTIQHEYRNNKWNIY